MRSTKHLYDWPRLDGHSFQALCADLLTMEGFSVKDQGVGADGGADLLATQDITFHAGHRKRYSWLVQAKYRANPSSTVKPSELGNIANLLSRFQADGYLLITNGRVTNKTFAEIRSVSEGKPPTYLASVWDNRILESKLLLYKDIRLRYFGVGEERSILVVDDEPRILEGLKHLFSLLAVQIYVATTPQAALKIAGERLIDVAVLDLVFPALDHWRGLGPGFALADSLRQLNPDIKIVYYSGFMTGEEVVARKRVEDAVFLSKGKTDPNDVVAAVRKELDRVRGEVPKAGAMIDPAGLLGSVTHAVRNQLSLIQLRLQLGVSLKESTLVSSLLTDAIDMLEQATVQLAAVAAAGEATQLPTIVVDEILQRAVESCRSLHGNATIHLELPIKPTLIQGVPVLLESAVFELIVNAIEASTPDPSKVVVGLEQVERERLYARITVADNGRGIPKQAIPNLFLPGYSRTKGRGGGMGLFFSAKVAQYHSGWIEVESQATGGTEVRMFVGISRKPQSGFF